MLGLLHWARIGANTLVGDAPDRRNPHAEPAPHRTQNVPTKSPSGTESGELIEAEMAHQWSRQIEREGAHIAGYALPGRASAFCADGSRRRYVLALIGTDGEFLPQGVDLGDFRDVLCAVVECCGESAFDRVLFQDALPVGDPARAGSSRFD